VESVVQSGELAERQYEEVLKQTKVEATRIMERIGNYLAKRGHTGYWPNMEQGY